MDKQGFCNEVVDLGSCGPNAFNTFSLVHPEMDRTVHWTTLHEYFVIPSNKGFASSNKKLLEIATSSDGLQPDSDGHLVASCYYVD